MEPIIIRAEPTAKEINQANFEHRCNTILIATVVVVFALTLISAIYGAISLCDFLHIKGQLANCVFIASLGVPVLCSVGFVNLERKIDFTAGKDPVTTQFVFNEKGVQVIDEQGSSFLKWSDIEYGYDCINSLAFAVNMMVFVLPKRNFKDGTQLKNTRQMMKDHIAKFTYARGNRPDVNFENTYDKSGATIYGDDEDDEEENNTASKVKIPLVSPKGAKVKLNCVYYPSELSEFQWRFVNRKNALLRVLIRCSMAYMLFRYSLWSCHIQFGQPDLVAILIIALGGFGYFYLLKSRRFLTIPAFYGGRMNAYFELGNDLVLYKTKEFEASIQWSEFSEIHETNRFFILKTQKFLLLIIPKRILKSEYRKVFVTNLLRRKKFQRN